MIFASFAIFAVIGTSFCYAEANIDVKTVIANGDPDKYNAAVVKIFSNFDMNGNGEIDSGDMDAFFKKGHGLFQSKIDRVQSAVSNEITTFDANKDGKVTLEEFKMGMQEFAGTELTVEKSLCHQAKAAGEKCKAEIKTAEKADSFLSWKVKVDSAMCHAGVSSLYDYPVQKCAVSATSCKDLVECYAPAKKNETSVAAAAQTTQNLVKRGAKGWRAAYWISMVFLGIASLSSVILLPFYIIILIISLKYIDFDRMDSKH